MRCWCPALGARCRGAGPQPHRVAHVVVYQQNAARVEPVAASAGLLVVVPAIIGAFFWRRGTAAGALASIIGGGVLVFWLQLTGTRLLGQGAGVWGLVVSVLLFVVVSLATRAPAERAREFMDHVKDGLARHRAI